MKKIYLQFIYRVLAFYGKKVIARYNPTIIAITGSVGKTSTKEAVFQVLHDQFGDDVRKNHGNLNAEIGVPLTILGFAKIPHKFLWPFFLIYAAFKLYPKKYPKYLVLEMGVEKKGDIAYLTKIARPDFGIITSVFGAHIENFQSLKEYQEEKISLINIIKPGGTLFLNFDDPELCKFLEDNIVSYSIDKSGTDFRAENIKSTLLGTEFRIICTGYKISVKSHLFGKHLVYNSLAAAALADKLGISLLKAGKSLEKIKPLPGRMNIIEGLKDSIIIDDTYNSNPSSAKAAADVLAEIDYPYRKVVIFGNMNELGKHAKEEHRAIGKYFSDKCDFAVFVGPHSEIMREAYGKKSNSLAFNNRKEVIALLPEIVKNNDLVLIKASQNKNFFEEITKSLMKNPKEASSKLVRQDAFWKNKKNY